MGVGAEVVAEHFEEVRAPGGVEQRVHVDELARRRALRGALARGEQRLDVVRHTGAVGGREIGGESPSPPERPEQTVDRPTTRGVARHHTLQCAAREPSIGGAVLAVPEFEPESVDAPTHALPSKNR